MQQLCINNNPTIIIKTKNSSSLEFLNSIYSIDLLNNLFTKYYNIISKQLFFIKIKTIIKSRIKITNYSQLIRYFFAKQYANQLTLLSRSQYIKQVGCCYFNFLIRVHTTIRLHSSQWITFPTHSHRLFCVLHFSCVSFALQSVNFENMANLLFCPCRYKKYKKT